MSSDLVLITGVTGHIGFRVLLDALKAGYKVRAAVRSEAAARVQQIKSSVHITALNLAPNTLTFVTVPDFLAEGAFDEAVKGVKYIIHVASPIPSARLGDGDHDVLFIQPAKRGTLGVLESAAKVPSVEKIVVTSSVIANVPVAYFATGTESVSTAAGRQEFVPGQYQHPMIAYGYSKVAALNSAEEWYREHQPSFSLVHIHPALVLGADLLVDDAEYNVKNGTNGMLLESALGSADPRFSGTVHVEDVAKAHVAALSPSIKGLQSFGLSTDADWTKLESILKKFYPELVESGFLKVDAGISGVQIPYDASASEKEFGFKFLDFEEQVKDVLDYYLKLAGKA